MQNKPPFPSASAIPHLAFHILSMPTIGITGGIGSGKSTFTQIFAAALGVEAFDADVCARRLLAEDAGVAAEVRVAFGDGVFGADGRPERPALRALVFADDPAPRRALEAILHPRVRDAWRGWLSEQRTPALVEIPLLYETGAEVYFDQVVVVGCKIHRGLRPRGNDGSEEGLRAQTERCARYFQEALV